ncbi:hypothetical protein [Burkholderia gladioli]|uniref:hypothetical protein n=1 Tax=Burkholderia gladioli TaxID=28095 RepID=UPI003EDFDD15
MSGTDDQYIHYVHLAFLYFVIRSMPRGRRRNGPAAFETRRRVQGRPARSRALENRRP